MQKAFSREWWADSWGGRGLVCDGLDLNVFFLLSLALPHSMKPEVKGKYILSMEGILSSKGMIKY